MHRSIASLLLIVMLVPAFAPLALARADRPEAMHCARQKAVSAMHCHHGMAVAPEPAPSEASFRSLEQCCQNHDCCNRGLTTARWAQAQSRFFSHTDSPRPSALCAEAFTNPASGLTRLDSARAPPRS